MANDSAVAALFADVGSTSRKLAQEFRTDDIIKFIQQHWNFWATDRRYVQDAVAQMDRAGERSVETLSRLIGIPEGIYFKRVTAKEVGAVYMNFPKSTSFETFMKCISMQPSAEACLFLVSGQSSTCISNLHVEQLPGRMNTFFKSRENAKDIYIFPVAEAQERMSLLRP